MREFIILKFEQAMCFFYFMKRIPYIIYVITLTDVNS